MMFQVDYSSQALKFLKKSDNVLAARILKKIEELKENPVLHDTKTIHGYNENLFRVRVGDYRILYEIDSKSNKLGIIKIDNRAKVYSF